MTVNTPWGPAVVPTDSGRRVITRPRSQLSHNFKRICKEVMRLVNTKDRDSKMALFPPELKF